MVANNQNSGRDDGFQIQIYELYEKLVWPAESVLGDGVPVSSRIKNPKIIINILYLSLAFFLS